ncbi:MAG: hypothetical protein AMXMBFR13_27830 [Phycisphaerae bacterium]
MEVTLTRQHLVVLFFATTSISGVCLALSEAPATRPAVNAQCPVMPGERVDPAFTYLYQGQMIGFCCEQCLMDFKAHPQRYESRLASFTGTAERADQETPTTGHPYHHEAEADSAHPASEVDGHGQDHGCCGGEPKGFFADLIPMLAKFHPPAVNFPIAMIIGAALAEALLFLTGRPVFAGAGRFCIWVGAIGAGGAALLGWFWGGFELADASRVVTAHRWLGTATVAWSAVMLFLGERAARREHGGRGAYRAALLLGALLVAATGFFGGSLQYGLMHYLT